MKKMKLLYCFVLILSTFLLNVSCFAQNNNKSKLYEALSSGKQSLLNEQLKEVSNSNGDDKNAFEGALLMRKAGTITVPAVKLSTFKKGHKKLEDAIKNNNQNIEYRFLRLMIQENAPKNLGYTKNIAEDAKMIKDGKSSVSSVVQNAINEYSKHSKNL